MEREKIITLIAEDLKHNQLLNGLNGIGLNDDNRYILSIDLVVADMMGYKKGKVPDSWLDSYHKTMLSIPHNLNPKEVQRRAIILFETLSTVKR